MKEKKEYIEIGKQPKVVTKTALDLITEHLDEHAAILERFARIEEKIEKLKAERAEYK